VNLIGEHTDYTGGLVLPMAIPFYTVATISPRDDESYDFESDRFEGSRKLARGEQSEATGEWSDYPVGVLRMLQQCNVDPQAFTLRLEGDVPLGSGLSSSASVEVASAVAMLAHAGATLPIEEIALLCQRAENDYVHSPCGIMDQFVVTAAKAGHALLLQTRTLNYEHISMVEGALANTRIVVVNSMVKHSIATGEYGDRRKQVETGEAVLVAKFPALRDLGDATLDQLAACKDAMPPASFRRCRHIVTENGRVREAKSAMLAGDPARLGKLMLEAHASQREDFECSTVEMDFLVDTAAALPGCFGARMTGGGFGGCTVNLVTRDHAESFATALKAAYRKRFDIAADSYVCEAVDGAMLRNAAAPELRNAGAFEAKALTRKDSHA
jgi:galactokinase